MADSSIVALIKRLRTRTQEGKLKWEEGAEDGVFQTAFPENVVQITERGRRLPTPAYIVSIFDREGSLAEETTDTDLESAWTGAYETMRDLYIEARRSAKGVDKAISNILSALGEDDDDIPF